MRKIASSLLMLIAIAGAASAGSTGETHVHKHGAESGTPEAPLDIVREPADVPPPGTGAGPRTVKVGLETVEVTGRLADGATYHYWTFNRKVPGPFIRVRVNDTVEVSLANPADSAERHSIDLHAVLGPGGGAIATDAAPGETKSFRFRATRPGLYVYHCATPVVARHVANGMYGLILVEPEGGLLPVDREFYVMQGEVYTVDPFGAKGFLAESKEKLMAEQPDYVVFNGSTSALLRSVQWQHVGTQGQAAQGQCRRDSPHLLWGRRAEPDVLISRDRRHLRQGLSHGFSRRSNTALRADGQRSSRRECCGRDET